MERAPDESETANRTGERWRREDPRARRSLGFSGTNGKGLHLVAERVGEPRPSVQEDPEPKASSRPPIERQRLSSMRRVHDAVGDPRTGAELRRVHDDARERLRLRSAGFARGERRQRNRDGSDQCRRAESHREGDDERRARRGLGRAAHLVAHVLMMSTTGSLVVKTCRG